MAGNELKSQLYNKCLEYVEQCISNVQVAINSFAESSKDETKSSAGDKHETGRAMAQLEQEKSGKQLQEALELKNMLLKINPDQRSTSISLGSIVLTDKGNFYISIAAGKILIDTEIYFAVSPASPIAKAFIGGILNQAINFNGLSYIIKAVV